MHRIIFVTLASFFMPSLCCGTTLQPDSLVAKKQKEIYKETELDDVSVVGKDRTQDCARGLSASTLSTWATRRTP